MRGAAATAGFGAVLAVCLFAPIAAFAAAPTTLPLWIDPRLLEAPPPAPSTPAAASTQPRFTVTRIAADGSRVTQAIDASGLQALSRPSVAVSAVRAAPVVAKTTAKTVPASVVRAQAAAVSPDDIALRAAAKRLTLEPTWTALARRSLAGDGQAQASLHAPDEKKPDGKAAFGLSDGRRYGEAGRFYMYAAMKNKGVGMNVVDHGENWSGDGLSYDQGGFAGQRSAGVGWRQGEVSTSLGWVHEKNRVNGLYGAPAEKDDRLALTFSWRPKVVEAAPPITK